MKNTNEMTTVFDQIKSKVANVASEILIRQAVMGTKGSPMIFVSEPTIPRELLSKETELVY